MKKAQYVPAWEQCEVNACEKEWYTVCEDCGRFICRSHLKTALLLATSHVKCLECAKDAESEPKS